MKVLHVSVGYYPATAYGGPVISMHSCAQALARSGTEVLVATTNSNGRGRIAIDTANLVQIEPNYAVRYYEDTITSRYSWPFTRNIGRHIAAADLIHLQDVWSLHAAQTLMLSRWHKKPVLISPRGIFSQWALGSKRKWAKRAWLATLIQPLVRDPRRVRWHATSDSERDDVVANMANASVSVVPNAIDCSVFERASTLSRGDYLRRFFPGCSVAASESIVLAAMGRLHPVKGFDLLVEALGRIRDHHPGAVLLIAGGDDGDSPRLEDLIKAKGLAAHARLIGEVRGDEKVAFLKGADAFLFPSHSENFGLACLEALACGLPTIASRHTPWAVIETDGAGRWVDNEPGTIASATLDLLTRPRIELQKGARRCAGRFDLSEVARAFNSVYEELIRDN